MISLESNIRSFSRRMATDGPVARQLPFAISVALNETARDAERNTRKRLARVIDRPTPFTLRGTLVRRASKRNLVARVGFKDRQAGYLRWQEEGGRRTPTGRALLVPGNRRRNRYGNIPRGAVQRLLARGDTFSGRIGSTAGIWRRTGNHLRLEILYASSADYTPRLGFASAVAKTARARFPNHLDRALAAALRTAR